VRPDPESETSSASQ